MSGVGGAFNYLGNQLGAIPGAVRNTYVDLMGGGAPKGQLPYDLQMEQAKQQQALADALMKQSAEDIPIQSYKGIQAPIPWTAILAKALQGAAGAYKRGQAEKTQREAMQADEADAQNRIDLLTKGKAGVTSMGAPGTASSQTTLDATLPQLSGGPAPTPGPQVGLTVPGAAPQSPEYGYTKLSPEEIMAEVIRSGGPKTTAAMSIAGPRMFAQQDKKEDRAYEEGRAKVRPTTIEEKRTFGIDPRTPAYTDANGGVHPITDPNQLTEEQRRVLANQDRSFGVQLQQLQLQRDQANRPVVAQYGSTFVDPHNPNKVIGKVPYSPEQIRTQEDLVRKDKDAVFKVDQTMSSLEKMMKMPGFNDAVGAPGVPFYHGGVLGYTIPGTDRASFRAELKTFKSKTFRDAVKDMVGLGALSNAEGEKIEASVGALDEDMKQADFRESAADIWRQMSAARNRLPGAKYMPKTFAEDPSFARRPLATRKDPKTGKTQVRYSDGSVEDAPD